MATFIQSFSYTGTDQTFTVPVGVNSIKIQAWGAGGGGSQAPGGAGGYAAGSLPVVQGDTLTIITGQGGGTVSTRSYGGGGAGGPSTGSRGSNGAGRSAARLNGTEVITAGGGGSSASRNLPQYSNGGSGGCTTGINAFNSANYAPGAVPARGGTQSAGGAGGVNPYNGAFNGSAGTAFQGGDGGFGFSTFGSGAGGGGGYFGGGGGSGEFSTPPPFSTDAGGAGGSSYIGGVTSGITLCTPQNTSPNVGNPQFPPNTTDANYIAGVGVGNSSRGAGPGGNGLVVITFDIVPDPIPITKKVSTSAAKVGDVLTYTLTIPNNGQYPASNVVITDPIPAGTSYVAGSTSSNVAFTGDPTTTINLTNPIAVGQTITVTYQVTVDILPTPNPIPNTATMNYSITPVVGAPPIDVTATSNTVTTLVFAPSRGVEFI